MNDKWLKPNPEVSFLTPTSGLIPAMAEIPDEFKRGRNPFVELTSKWFFEGLDKALLEAKSGIDRRSALIHLSLALQDWGPQHEHKTAAVAYLMSLWFTIDPSGPNRVEREKKGLPPKKVQKKRKSPKVSRRFGSMNFG